MSAPAAAPAAAAASSSSSSGASGVKGKIKVGTLRRVDRVDENGQEEQCWANAEGTTFDTRIGPAYPQNKKKDSSKQCIYECVAIDIYITDAKISHVARLMDLPGDHIDDAGNDGYLPQTFVVNCQIPNYPLENALWGACAGDGPGYSLVFYFTLSAFGREAVAKRGKLVSAADDPSSNHRGTLHHAAAAKPFPATPPAHTRKPSTSYYYSKDDPYCFRSDTEPEDASLRLLHNFVAADEGTDLRQRFKGIARLMNVNDAGLGGATKKLITMYNGTPFLIRTCSVFWRGETYFEVDVDVHRFSYTSRLGLSGVKERIKDCVFDFGFVIEGHSDFELPENMLGAVRFSKLDLTQAMKFPG